MPPLMRKIFKFLNKFFMVPMFKLGLGGLITNPFTGYIMVMKVIGRKSGKVRHAPVNYAIHQGMIYCVSGGRASSDWYKNLLANPDFELILPGGAVYGHASEETDPEIRRVVIRQILKNAGFAGFFEGYNPWKVSDAELMDKSRDLPLIKIVPQGVGNGASDPRGWAWFSVLVVMLGIVLLVIKMF